MHFTMADNLKEYYENLYETHGRHSASVQHVSYEEQCKRFKILTQNIDATDSIIDLGCGLADLYAYLKTQHFIGQYLGLDFVENFIHSNEELYREDQQSHFKVFDLYLDELPIGFDHVILSGVFNNLMKDNEEFMKMTVLKMFNAAKQSISFNMLSTYVDFQDNDLYYYDPKGVFDFCKKEISPLVTLKHDYGLGANNYPYEFTVFIRKS